MKKRAILFVENTEKIETLAQFLAHDGWEIITAGETASVLKQANIPITIDKSLIPTLLSPNSYVNLIYQILKTGQQQYITNQTKGEIQTIELVCVNMTPTFNRLPDFLGVQRTGNCIDIVNHELLRSAAKNFLNVIPLCDPDDYEEAIDMLKIGNDDKDFRLYLAGKALNLTAAYDCSAAAAILVQGRQVEYPSYFMIPLLKLNKFEHGINPHQSAYLYSMNDQTRALSGVKKISGKTMSARTFQNCLVAWKNISMFMRILKNPFSVSCFDCNNYPFTIQFSPQTGKVMSIIVKNGNPVSAAFGSNVTEAFLKTSRIDTNSFEGSCLSTSSVVDESLAHEILKYNFEAVIAPDFTREAKEILSSRQDLILSIASILISNCNEYHSVDGGLVSQSQDNILFDNLRVVTNTRPTQLQMDSMAMGMMLAVQAKSDSAIVINDYTTVGISTGQTNSNRAVHYALENAKDSFENNLTSQDRSAEILVSDSVIKFDEKARMLADLGVKAIIQTGGAPNDQEFIDFCNEHGISMVFTGIQHLAF